MVLLTGGSVRSIARSKHGRETWPRATATVASDYIAGRHVVPVEFVHPVTHQRVSVKIVVVNGSALPQPGAQITIAADPANPDSAVLPGDGDDLQEIVVGWIVIVGAAAAAAAARWTAIARTERLIRTSRPSFAMLAALSSAGRFRYRVECSLYALDAAPAAGPICTFPVLTSGGLPVDGAAFPVDVRGRPLPGGLLVARAGDHIIRPVRRPLIRGQRPRPAVVLGAIEPLPRVDAPAGDDIRTAPLWRCLDVFAVVGLIGAVVLAAIAVPRMIAGVDRSDRLQRVGRAVVVELESKNDTTLAVRYQPPSGSAIVLFTDGSTERSVGRQYPAHIDASNHIRLDADPYDWGLPLGFLLAWWGLVALVVWPCVRWWRDARRFARAGPWYDLSGGFDGPDGPYLVTLPAPSDAGGHVTACRAYPRHAGFSPCKIAGDLDPGEAIAIAGSCASIGRARIAGSASGAMNPGAGAVGADASSRGLRLSIGTDSANHLTIVPVGSSRSLTNLCLTSAGMDIWTKSCEPVALPWTDFENVRSIMDAQPPRDGWAVVNWAAGQADAFGVAIRLSGSYADKSAAILTATRTFWRRVAMSGSSLTGRSAPVLPGTTVMTRFEAEYSTITMLCKLVANDDRARGRLDDAERVKRLARDLAAGMLKPHPLATGIGRDSTDIHVALRQLGFVHPMNRPLTNVGIPTVSEIADKVEAALRSNRFRVGRESDREQIEEIVRRDFVDVEPWPFAALVDD